MSADCICARSVAELVRDVWLTVALYACSLRYSHTLLSYGSM